MSAKEVVQTGVVCVCAGSMSTYLPAYIWTTDKFNSHTHKGGRNTKSKAKLIQLALKALKHTHTYIHSKEGSGALVVLNI